MTEEIRTLLKKELSKRKDKNPRYSLRAFSSHLGVSNSYLSKVLRGESSLSSEMLERFAKQLNLSKESLKELQFSLNSNRLKKKLRKLR
jgi:transcriptional regulator with XRE-family HTH domain